MRSDIDVTVLLSKHSSEEIEKILIIHQQLRKFLPIIGELVFFSEEKKEALFNTINPLELRRDPLLMERFHFNKAITDVDKIIYLHKFIISNWHKKKALSSRKRKMSYLFNQIDLSFSSELNLDDLINILSNLVGADSDLFKKDYKFLLETKTIYPDTFISSPAVFSLFYNKICFINFELPLNDLEKEILFKNFNWELWGSYSNQLFSNRFYFDDHIRNLFKNAPRFLNINQIENLKSNAIKLDLIRHLQSIR